MTHAVRNWSAKICSRISWGSWGRRILQDIAMSTSTPQLFHFLIDILLSALQRMHLNLLQPCHRDLFQLLIKLIRTGLSPNRSQNPITTRHRLPNMFLHKCLNLVHSYNNTHKPMRIFTNWHNQEVMSEQIFSLGPSLYRIVILLYLLPWINLLQCWCPKEPTLVVNTLLRLSLELGKELRVFNVHLIPHRGVNHIMLYKHQLKHDYFVIQVLWWLQNF